MPRSRKALQVDTTENRSQMSRNANVRSVASTGSERRDAFSLPSIVEIPNSKHTFTTCTESTAPVQAPDQMFNNPVAHDWSIGKDKGKSKMCPSRCVACVS